MTPISDSSHASARRECWQCSMVFLSSEPCTLTRLFFNFILSGTGSQWSDVIASVGSTSPPITRRAALC